MEMKLNPIEVVVDFKKDGNLVPIRMRLIDDESQYQVIRFRSSRHLKRERIGKENLDFYFCNALINNKNTRIELKFENTRCQWSLYKMQV